MGRAAAKSPEPSSALAAGENGVSGSESPAFLSPQAQLSPSAAPGCSASVCIRSSSVSQHGPLSPLEDNPRVRTLLNLPLLSLSFPLPFGHKKGRQSLLVASRQLLEGACALQAASGPPQSPSAASPGVFTSALDSCRSFPPPPPTERPPGRPGEAWRRASLPPAL